MIQTCASKNVPPSKLKLWDIGAIIRELLQNASDAVVRVISTNLETLSYNSVPSDFGIQGSMHLQLGDLRAVEYAIAVETVNDDENPEDNTFIVSLVVYNFGCALAPDAFVDGSLKGV
jgi:hypothetical protein